MLPLLDVATLVVPLVHLELDSVNEIYPLTSCLMKWRSSMQDERARSR